MTAPMLVMFAVEGVLVDSDTVRARAWSTTLGEVGVRLSLEQCRARFTGRSDRAAQASVEGELGRPLPADFAARLEARLRTGYDRELRPVHDAAGTLRRMRLPACALSGASRGLARHALEVAGLWSLLAPNLFTADMVEREPPAAALYHLAAAEMGVPVARCAVIDATVHGIRGARAAGMTALGFAGSSPLDDGQHARRLAAAGAHIVADRLSELPPLIRARAA